ncbi:aldo/keto reductase [Streptomyces parvulus]|uniref:aldo/keto reductase n=1 Tax=Streptomyces parvulus TaxID=146923 RepID=UPI00380F4F4D
MVTTVALNDGTAIPQLGFGTYLIPAEQTGIIVGKAIEAGYRHIDTAQMYGNEEGVGQAIAASGIERKDFYVTSKLNNGNHQADDVRRTFDETLTKLGLEYLDLFLIHWPLPMLYGGDFVSTWKALVGLLTDGRLRTAGVSNFEPAHLERIIDETGVVPAVNQIEAHPYFANDGARQASLSHGIVVEAWSPLGQGAVLSDPEIAKVAADHEKSVSQIILRWHVQRGDVVFPKTTRPERMDENLQVFDFSLTADQMRAIDALDRGEVGRVGPHPNDFDYVPIG